MAEYILPLQKLIEQFCRLSGVGQKTAVRYAFSVLDMTEEDATAFANAIIDAKKNICECEVCGNLSDEPVCSICSDAKRDPSLVCVVEDTKTVMALEKVPAELIHRYGVAGGTMISSDVLHVEEIVEKPSAAEAPSDLAVAARYVYTPEIFECLKHTLPGKGGEIQLPDATRLFMDQGGQVFGKVFAGTRYDIGDKMSFLKATVEFGLRRSELAAGFSSWIVETARRIEEGKNV
jgi:UTP-glucose-1-phosphate uridylyltransferase